MENKIRHLEMIQGVINRMASNSFYLKGWAVTLIAGIFALASKDSDKGYIFVAYIPIIIFWIIDSYYLLQERLYRALYNSIRTIKESEVDYDMNANKFIKKTKQLEYCNCLFSATEAYFYLPLALLSTGIIFITPN